MIADPWDLEHQTLRDLTSLDRIIEYRGDDRVHNLGGVLGLPRITPPSIVQLLAQEPRDVRRLHVPDLDRPKLRDDVLIDVDLIAVLVDSAT